VQSFGPLCGLVVCPDEGSPTSSKPFTNESDHMQLYTIGFTEKSAEEFFTLLQSANVRLVLDTRLNNRSQLAGFSKSRDLAYFLRVIGGIDYRHVEAMAPTAEMLEAFRGAKGGWSEYEPAFRALLEQRRVAESVQPAELDHACLLCSEHSPEHCHRRIVAEYLKENFPGIEIIHLM
jgi:uncharacterized protein (DUF488 family)